MFNLLKIKEMIEWTTIIVAVIGALAGGGITSLVTLREKKTGKQLENQSNLQEIELKLVNELQDQIESLNTRIEKKDEMLAEKDDIISDLRDRLDKSRSKCVASDLLKCLKISCLEREPKIGTRYVDVEKIVEDTES